MRILLAGVLGGIAIYVWTSIAHMALRWQNRGLMRFQNESAVLSAMQSSIGEKTGLYVFPGSSIAAHAVVEHRVGTIRELTNAGIDIHVYVDSLIRNHFE